MTLHEELAVLDGAKAMLKWIDSNMEDKGSASRVYAVQTYKIRSLIAFAEKKKNYIYSQSNY